jgi:hypothetical protein
MEATATSKMFAIFTNISEKSASSLTRIDGGNSYFQNVCKFVPDYTALPARRP